MIQLLKIGSDPEFFIVDDKNNPIGSYVFFDGTKEEPEEMDNGFGILKDNLLVEGNIPPSASKEEFVDNMEFLKELIQSVLTPQKAILHSADVMEFDPMWINTPDGQYFGCSQFKSAYAKKNFDTPTLRNNKRQAGFHIHISYTINDKCDIFKREMNGLIAKAMDCFLGMPSDEILFSEERRGSYGVLGAYRDTSYGLEYRSLGGFFTASEYLPWVYDQTIKAIDFCKSIENLELLRTLTSANNKNYEKLNISLAKQIPVKIQIPV